MSFGSALFLGEVGHHDGGIKPAFYHLVTIDKDFGITTIEVDVLIEKHWGVAMGVEGEMVVVPLACAVIAGALLHEMTEKTCGVFVVHALGMPLHADDALELCAFEGF